MPRTILLYGATGYSGRLIAAELKLEAERFRTILAGRDSGALRALGEELQMEHRVFSLDWRADVVDGLAGVDALLNAAGPFAWTAERLSKVALEVGCHYVDINGELDVYKRLDDLGIHGRQRGLALVSGAGFWAAASDVLLDRALGSVPPDCELGAVRIAMSRIVTFSRGSADTVWRSLREQVAVVRRLPVDDGGGHERLEMTLAYEPVGKLERSFDFGTAAQSDLRIATAASLVDTMTARLTVARRKLSAERIESYVEAGAARRMAYQVGSWLAPLAAIPVVRTLVHQPIALMSDGPSAKERESEPHVLLLQVEDRLRTPLFDWRWQTPNVYQFTAQLAAAVAQRAAQGKVEGGWRTPAEAIGPMNLPLTGDAGALRGCRLEERSVV